MGKFPETGVYFLVAIEESLEQLTEFPALGAEREFQDKRLQNVRMWRVKGYEIPDFLHRGGRPDRDDSPPS